MAPVKLLMGITSMEYQSPVDLQGNMFGHLLLVSPLTITTRFGIVRVLNIPDPSRLHLLAMTIFVSQPHRAGQPADGSLLIAYGMDTAVRRASAALTSAHLHLQSYSEKRQLKVWKFGCVETALTMTKTLAWREWCFMFDDVKKTYFFSVFSFFFKVARPSSNPT